MFKSPFSFEGRIRRTEYGLSYLTFCFSAYVLGAMFEGSEGVSIVAEILLIIPLLWFLWAQGAKRCHDVGNSGWFQLIPFYILWLIFAAGRKGKNKYGNDPKDNDEEEDVLQYVKPEIANTPDENHLNT
ncbi:DUF805 domain-containing protein [Olivibacter sp. CPCC 100613]|uniref:DUF805 domain-containing protein n=1 Tax=Olivibacter sp. CPCC 100613 TaxID=3079931 RepID=UPI002FF524CF